MRRLIKAAAAAVALTVAATGCSATAGGEGQSFDNLRIMVPNAPGGGYDTTARTAAQIMSDEGLTPPLEVFNLDGAGGTVGLARTVNEKANADLMMMMGLGVVGSVYTNQSEATLQDTTPIARLISEPEIIAVPADSPFQTLDDLVAAWKANPGDVPVGGGSSPGGPDHLAPHLLAQEVGIDPTDVNYVSYDGGGPLLAALLGGEVAFGVSGVGEYKDQIKTGQLRVLALTSAERLEELPDVPTLMEQGVDLEFINWRGFVAPPGITDAEQQKLIKLVEDMHATAAWREALATNGWTDSLQTGEDFADFIDSENQRVEDVLKKLGLA